MLYSAAMFGFAGQTFAQDSDDEVALQFRHDGVVNTYVSALYAQDQFYLSIRELFSSLGIDHQIDSGTLTIRGNYLGQGEYSIDLNNRTASFLDREISFTADDYAITDFDYYLHPDIFYELLEMSFTVDFSTLSVSLEVDETMPIIAQRERERRRDRTMRTQRELRRDFYPLRYDREQSFFNAGFLDYNLTANVNPQALESNSYLYSANIGTEVLGGDFQGSIFGSYSQTATSLRSSGLRWRYGIRDNSYISTITAGQATSRGLTSTAYTGLRVTNEPLEPRHMFGETAFTGTVAPNSEVELYRNNTLIDFTEANESGEYQFNVPITYGSTQYSIRSYSPTGEETQRSARLQIPFNFLPPGEVTYSVDAGRLDNPIAGAIDRGYMGTGNVDVGLTDRFTASGGVEYYEDFHDELPSFKGRLSSRLFTNHLLSLEAANEAFYRASLSAVYANNASINVNYTKFNRLGGIYNPGRNESAIRANVFTPFEIGNFPLFLRWSFSNEQRATSSVSRYRVDLNTRLGRANVRLGFRDSQVGRLQLDTTPTARINASTTYNFGRGRQTPRLIRGVFARAQMNYVPAFEQVEDVELQISRSVSRRGRFQLSGGRNFSGDFNLFRFSFTFDFTNVRTNTSIRSRRNNTTASQSVRGSMGYDSNNNNLLFTNRQQVGRSGVAVRMFVDNNNTGTYDEGDELIHDSAARIDRAGGSRFTRDGITYISQLQPYRQYNMSINKGAINNPLLVPSVENFSIVTDPNQYKLIEIPFYMSGIIDGMVYQIDEEGRRSGTGGLRLYLQQINTEDGVDPHSEELRTFSDGSFYAYEIPPGEYTLEVDPSQLDFLNSRSEPQQLEFEVEGRADGDFVEGLEINLIPDDYELDPIEAPEDIALDTPTDEVAPVDDELPADYQRYSDFVDETLRLLIKAQNAFYEGEHIQAISYVDESLEIYETAQGYALRGSINYLLGNRMEAQRNWQMALRINPDIFIPDTETLDDIILSL